MEISVTGLGPQDAVGLAEGPRQGALYCASCAEDLQGTNSLRVVSQPERRTDIAGPAHRIFGQHEAGFGRSLIRAGVAQARNCDPHPIKDGIADGRSIIAE
jgi:hypothetical protein